MSSVRYSPLCDSDPLTYQRYLLACVLGNDGTVGGAVDSNGRGVASVLGSGGGGPVGGGGRAVAKSFVAGSAWLDGGGYAKILDAFVGDSDGSQGPGASGSVEAGMVDGGAESHRGGSKVPGVVDDAGFAGDRQRGAGGCDERNAVSDEIGVPEFGKNHKRNKKNREKARALKKLVSSRVSDDSGVSGCGSGGSVHTVDTRTGVEIEASQTLAVRRVAENKLAAKKAEADRLLVEFRIKSLQDKSRTKAVERLAAARMEEKINKAKKNSETYFKGCDQSLKSLGSTGSAGEFALKTQIKDARDNEAILAYVQEQNRILVHNASPEVLDAVSRVKKPVIEEEFDAFGDCPSDYNEDEAEAYCNDRNRRNDEMARRLQCVDEQPIYGRW